MNILNGYDGRRVQLKRELMAWNMGYQKRSRVKQELSGLFDLPLNRELEWFSDMVGKLLPPLLVLITTPYCCCLPLKGINFQLFKSRPELFYASFLP